MCTLSSCVRMDNLTCLMHRLLCDNELKYLCICIYVYDEMQILYRVWSPHWPEAESHIGLCKIDPFPTFCKHDRQWEDPISWQKVNITVFCFVFFNANL